MSLLRLPLWCCLLLLSCSDVDNNSLEKSFNSVQTNQFPNVVRVGTCSATAYHPRHVIFSAHCLNNVNSPADLTFKRDGRDIKAVSIYAHSQYKQKPESQFDLAIVKFEGDIVDAGSAVYLSKSKATGQKVQVVGYGLRGFYEAEALAYVFTKGVTPAVRSFVDALPTSRRSELERHRQTLQQATENGEARPALYQELLQKVRSIHDYDASGKPNSKKRVGVNSIKQIANGNILITARLEEKFFEQRFRFINLYAPDELSDTAAREGAIASFGDSGGPLLDVQGNLVGVASTLDRRLESLEADNYYTDLQSQASLEFFREAERNGMIIPTSQPSREIDRTLFVAVATPAGQDDKVSFWAYSDRIEGDIFVCEGGVAGCSPSSAVATLKKGSNSRNIKMWASGSPHTPRSGAEATYTLATFASGNTPVLYRTVKIQRR